ncbi:MAG: bifunctional (p)ppGpp synthetase/guanosine-3',5'-bis(diphosphate) 3'-pyrophosphohydrolase [Erysipelothrix sp.]|nr:bifunctional (p)ppGpp synthetase/guanosine-3',5'-bis(diphosphate) 3'-pyrophosphohydrolase [Erysipelothrix sp.]
MAKTLDYTKEQLIAEINSQIKDQKSRDDIFHALEYAEAKHAGQVRKSGESYFTHLVNVAYILMTLHVQPVTIQAGLLHDVIEDSGVTHDELAAEFTEEVASMVEAVTKIGNIQFKDEKEYLAENHRKIFIAMAKDVRVILIKLVDRLHNMRTLQFQPEYKQKKIANETLSVYAPIAHRLGINDIKNELEDLSFLYLHREKYYEIVKLVEVRKAERDAQVQEMIEDISEELTEHEIPHRIFGRSKHLYSIYKKMNQKNKRFDEILDLLAIRIVTDTEVACYEILGYIHARYRPIPGRLKDYIAMPKVNMYQSLHTTIMAENGHIFEVQIRTENMDLVAERGIAAHWLYKDGQTGHGQSEIEDKLAWLKDFNRLTTESDGDATEYMEFLQQDIFEANVYVMTPKGRVIDLPQGSTPIDFAYRIHTEVGHSTIGATVNDVLVPLNTELKTGDVVSIRTAKNSTGPSEDWLKFVKTNHARSKIRNFIQKQELQNREEMISKGEVMMREELRKRQLDEKEYMKKEKLEPLFSSFNIKNYDDFMYAISVKSLSLQAVMEKLQVKSRSIIDFTKLFGSKPKPKQQNRSGIRVSGIDTMKISLANCCSPVPGDEIMGYVSKGQGVKVHRADCPNIRYETKRLIDVEWDEATIEGKFEVQLSIYCVDRSFLLTDVVTLTQQNKITISYVNAQMDEDLIHSTITLKVMIENQASLRQLIANIRKIDSVVSVERSIL